MKEALKVAIGSICFALLMCWSYKARADDWTGDDKTLHFAAGRPAWWCAGTLLAINSVFKDEEKV